MKKGFTLIELLAVIVILAIIALIATPIILNIISTSKEESDKRSIELYGEAIKNAIANYTMNNPEDDDITLEDIEDKIEYKGSKVECGTIQIYTDGTIYLAECKVDTKEVEYTYGKIQEEATNQIYKYYSFSSGNIGGSLPEDKSLTQSFDSNVYFLLESEDNETVSAVYSCFNMDGNEYCLKGGDGGAAYETNVNILKKAFKDVVYDEDTGRGGCSTWYNDILEVDVYSCSDTLDKVNVSIDSGGDSKSRGDVFTCIVSSEGNFSCKFTL